MSVDYTEQEKAIWDAVEYAARTFDSRVDVIYSHQASHEPARPFITITALFDGNAQWKPYVRYTDQAGEVADNKAIQWDTYTNATLSIKVRADNAVQLGRHIMRVLDRNEGEPAWSLQCASIDLRRISGGMTLQHESYDSQRWERIFVVDYAVNYSERTEHDYAALESVNLTGDTNGIQTSEVITDE